MTEASQYKYRVFIACSAADRVGGEWLRARLEDYLVRKPLLDIDTAARFGSLALIPIYWDCDHSADNVLPSDRTRAALQASQFLVVLCSPAAANSLRINSHIRRFRRMGRSDRVIPVLLAGEACHWERGSIPPELHCILGRYRALGCGPGRPGLIARLQGDAQTVAMQKAIAELLGHRRDDIADFVAATCWRRAMIGRIIAAGLLVLALAFDRGLVFARYELSHNEGFLNYTLAQMTALTRKAVATSDYVGLPPDLSRRVLGVTEAFFNDIAKLGQDRPSLRLQKALMQIELARLHRFLGSTESERGHAAEARRLLNALGDELPGNLQSQIAFSIAHSDLGDLMRTQDRTDEAFVNFDVVHVIADGLAVGPRDADRQRELPALLIKMGDASVARGSLNEAIEDYDESLLIAGRLATAEPRDARWRQGLMLSHARMGDVLRLQGKLDEALESYSAAQAVAHELASAEPGHIAAQRGLAVTYFGIGEILQLQDRADEALASYRASGTIVQPLAVADPANAEWQYHLGISHDRIASLLEARNDFAAALAEYRIALAFASRLQAAEPDNAILLRNLGVAYGHIGDVLFALEDLAGALQAYETKRAIIRRLVAGNSYDSTWQHELGASHARLALVLEARHDFPAAAREYEACLAIATRLAAAERDDAQVQLNLAVNYRKLAEVHHLLGNSRQALLELRQGREIVLALLDTAPAMQLGIGDLALFESRISALEGRASAGPSSGRLRRHWRALLGARARG